MLNIRLIDLVILRLRKYSNFFFRCYLCDVLYTYTLIILIIFFKQRSDYRKKNLQMLFISILSEL